MSDIDVVRDVLTFASPTGDETHDALAALDRIEAELEGWRFERYDERLVLAEAENKRLLEDVVELARTFNAENARLHGIEEAARTVCGWRPTPSYGQLAKAQEVLRTALERG